MNSKNPFGLFCDEVTSDYFIDKSKIISELIPLVAQGQKMIDQEELSVGKSNKYVCITRPRRFGKTLIASMIASFFSKGVDSREIFQCLRVGASKEFETHINKHNVFYISFNEIPQDCSNYQKYIGRIEKRLRNDLKKAFPEVVPDEDEAIWDVLSDIYEREEARFIFILDEWDYIFHRDFVKDKERIMFIEFLSNLLKGKSYVELAYMTGILPISKYSSGSELNMFYEYTMATRERYSEYFGFTGEEVDELYQRYLKINQVPRIRREELRLWYDGYQMVSGKRLYNPRSVVGALGDNQLGSYWTSAGPYDEIFYYISHNVAQVRDTLALLVAGMPVSAKVQEYAASSMNLTTRDEILSAMVVYGFLSFWEGHVSIPNKELMDKFADMIEKEPDLGYVYRLAKESRRMLKATKTGDTAAIVEILEQVHNDESPIMSYNNEAELAAVINLAYLEARDSYRVEREDKAGLGFADFVFYPLKADDDCIILELKVNHTAGEAIEQIKRRKYALNFQKNAAEKSQYTGRILAVGIAYDKKSKKHCCEIEILGEKGALLQQEKFVQ